MGENHDAILRDVNIGLDGVGANGQGPLERHHGVLGEGGLVASVGDGLGERSTLNIRHGTGEDGYRRSERRRRWRRGGGQGL